MTTPQLGTFKIPEIQNEPMRSYAPGTPERDALYAEVKQMAAGAPYTVPVIINGQNITSGEKIAQPQPHNHSKPLAIFHTATPDQVKDAITGALEAKAEWETLPWSDRAAIFLKAADLVSGKYRYKIMAATILGQGKNAWQAEIDAAAELTDFFRFGVKYVEELYAMQPPRNTPGSWNRSEYRALEGFVLAISPFNFTAIGGNLPGTPALVGNVALWKPSPMAVYANYITYQILMEAGVPPGVIQFLPTSQDLTPALVAEALKSPHFAALHFTGSTHVFKGLWKQIGSNMDTYRGYPRVVGETGGKNFHILHSSADVKNAVAQSIRAGFEYQGQKCSALSRLYVPDTLWPEFKELMLKETAKLKVGDQTTDPAIFIGPVISKASYDKILGYIEKAKAAGGEVLIGGTGDDSTGYFVRPSIILTKDPKSVTMTDEIFGPVITIYVYPSASYTETLHLIDSTTSYALTGAIFSTNRKALIEASNVLRNAAGNVYFNEKCTGAVVGQQPFGGARGSGTNDKAGSLSIFGRFVSARSVKENFVPLGESDWGYPSNLV
ncbi:delta-1-pyrroline-5-carboxylate dehydrogenase [Flagelloscypha sp. PMI_526]|nr:delta-1-pyrroline-5-carboxylate dehydrogenase [Flagelloscypha sp. PMI_526]